MPSLPPVISTFVDSIIVFLRILETSQDPPVQESEGATSRFQVEMKVYRLIQEDKSQDSHIAPGIILSGTDAKAMPYVSAFPWRGPLFSLINDLTSVI